MKVFVVDVAKCNGCYGCQLACKDEHVDNDWMPYAKPQPDTGHFWMKLIEKTHGQVPKVNLEYTPYSCMHCADPACVKKSDAFYQREDGLVILDPVKAEGKKELVEACPYGVVYWNEFLNIAQKCTGCAHLVDEGQLPHCVDLCATGALRFGEEEEFAGDIAKAEVMRPELGTRPRTYYLNLPKLFIAGEVWDQASDEIIEGAKLTLTNTSGVKMEAESDDFGDFWFRKLNPGTYTLKVEAAGYQTVVKNTIELQDSLNIGDIPMQK
ncbi:4Fe-4S dicluster domain-containing protein [Sporomusa acidovorans]|uniref:Pyrogallol hydroxytransferase small subunit n=1 Tax=Sporomusa acidovorans (strain ATCC 49682 / DSM 3132 / Mol) TaxID=1123286 RepID=A0ABZ3JAF4_SPOA4|nr:4Fe-4S dicluster domain-containing protein [Sporomusa acidovorans]OZC21847.1 pyrogallol hydroxytransferase small subunit [Sporomusa acidovorans DSM 3132]SDD54991.1 Fe-S-cluster-containing dehydrogenase component [Sporomusa acidovorans]